MRSINTLIVVLFIMQTVPQSAFAMDILCVDQTKQDSTYAARFTGKDAEDLKVTLQIPTGETSAVSATGKCETEEDSTELSLRCVKVTARNGEEYFARIDGSQATIAKTGKIVAKVPCYPDADVR
jgi:hypothetical protein